MKPTEEREQSAETEKTETQLLGDSVIRDVHRTGAKCVVGSAEQDPCLPGEAYHVIGALRFDHASCNCVHT